MEIFKLEIKMTLELLAVIAQLCLTPNGRNYSSGLSDTADFQIACQRYYVQCVLKEGLQKPLSYGDGSYELKTCIGKKP